MLGSFEVVTTTPYSGFAMVAHLKYGDGFWTYYANTKKPPLKALTFYKGRILGDNVSLDVISGEET